MNPLTHLTVCVILLLFALPAQARQLPASIGDADFRALIEELSEPGGSFPNQFMSNEDSAQFVIPSLKSLTREGGVYVGVGSEQNFTYIAAIRPRIAFIVDIRRDNLREHLMYKALFEMSEDRAGFVSRLFSRRRPEGLGSASTVDAIFEGYQNVEPDPELYEETLRAVMDRLSNGHGIPLGDADAASIAQAMSAFRNAGPHTLKGFGDGLNPTYAQLMVAADLEGGRHSYLASEETYRAVRDMELRNLIVPVVGDFAGDKALAGIGRYLRGRGAVVDTFYLSNVERYLFEQGEHGRKFYANAAALPRSASGIFIRSLTTDISRRLGIPIPEGPARWRTFLYSMEESLAAVADGRIRSYAELFAFGTR